MDRKRWLLCPQELRPLAMSDSEAICRGVRPRSASAFARGVSLTAPGSSVSSRLMVSTNRWWRAAPSSVTRRRRSFPVVPERLTGDTCTTGAPERTRVQPAVNEAGRVRSSPHQRLRAGSELVNRPAEERPPRQLLPGVEVACRGLLHQPSDRQRAARAQRRGLPSTSSGPIGSVARSMAESAHSGR